MRIALDAMGGDYAPAEIVKGAVEAVAAYDLEVILVGQEEGIKAELKNYGEQPKIFLHHASEVVEMDEHPVAALRKKKDSSIVVATQLVKEGKAQAVVSAGSTGAQMTAALFGLGRIKGIDRPAIAIVLPTQKGPLLLLDVGANAEAKPKNLLQFAIMGSTYVEQIFGINNPKVGLLNIGEESTKGNELSIAAHRLLSQASINFIGNVEGRDVPAGKADVVVCDGFVGNVVLKFAEGLVANLTTMVKEGVKGSWLGRIGAALLYPNLRNLKDQLDWSVYGGAPLLGINGVSVICHGSSKAKAIKNAIRVAKECVEGEFLVRLQNNLALGGEDDD